MKVQPRYFRSQTQYVLVLSFTQGFALKGNIVGHLLFIVILEGRRIERSNLSSGPDDLIPLTFNTPNGMKCLFCFGGFASGKGVKICLVK